MCHAAVLGACTAPSSQPATAEVPRESLYRINADGSGLLLLRDDPTRSFWGPAWSPDGTTICVTIGTLDGTTGELWLLDAAGQHPIQLTHNGRNNYYPAWSHDGKHIAFITQQGSDVTTSEITRINVDGSDEHQLTANHAWEYGASWSPDDQRIVFGSKLDGTWQLYTMNADGTMPQPLPTRAPGNAPVWSPDGQQIAFKSDYEGNDNIYVVHPDGSQQRNLTPKSTAINSTPTWSPDSHHIAFWSDRDGGSNIFVMNRDGSNLVNVNHDPYLNAGLPSWSPDGTTIIFHAYRDQPGVPAISFGVIVGTIVGVLIVMGVVGVWWRRRG
jgi:TolB protein